MSNKKYMIDMVVEAYEKLIMRLEDEVGEKISQNSSSIERLLVDTIINNRQVNPNKRELNKGYRNEIEKKNKGERTLKDFYTSFYSMTILKDKLYINDTSKNKILRKHPIGLTLEFSNLPALMGILFSGKVLDFNQIIEIEHKELEKSIEVAKDLYRKNEKKWKEENIISDFLYDEDKTDLDKMNLIMTFASKIFKIDITDLSTLVYGIGILGYHYNGSLELDISEKELLTIVDNLLDVLQKEELLTPLIGEIYKLDEFLFNKLVTIVG